MTKKKEIDHSVMKDPQGRYRTKSLFVETIQKDQVEAGFVPLFTLRARDGYVDLHSLYLEESDPTEYNFALRAFGSWEHFMKLQSLEWFKQHLNIWRQEVEVKLRSEGIRALAKSAKRDGSRGLSAAKWLAEKGWEPKKRGRPSKEEVEAEKRAQLQMEEELAGDASRLLN